MKLTFLGSSHGVPEPCRKWSSILITIGKNRYIADIGCDILPELANRNINLNTIKGIFVTHPHGDHCNGIFALTEFANWYATDCNPKILFPIDNVKGILESWLRLMNGGSEPRPINIEKYTAGKIYDDGVLAVSAIPTKHCNDSYGFLFEAEGKKILYTGDLKYNAEDFPIDIVNDGVDFLIGESAHFSTVKYAELLMGKPVKHFVITHHSPACEHFIETKQLLKDIPMTLVFDGMEFDI